MTKYYVNNNAQSISNDHEVHKEGCYWLSIANNTKYLGLFNNCQSAVREAKKHYIDTNGCAYCCPSCHTT
jgi:aminoglycoside/choline kinase family phosphotransferase